MNRYVQMLSLLLMLSTLSAADAAVYSGAMDSRAGQQHIRGFTAQSKAFKAGGNPGEGLRLEWQVDNVTVPGSWTYTYRLLRGTSKNKGFAFFDIETAADFTAANILSRQVAWATGPNGASIPSGLNSVTISNPINFDAVHDFSNAAVSEANFSTVALSKNDLSHYSGDPARVSEGQPGNDASDTPSVGPVAHPFYGIRVTFPGSNINLAYEASEWEFKIVSDRGPMWGSFFGWGDQTAIPPNWYSNVYNNNIDNPVRLTLPPADSRSGSATYQGWILVPGPLTNAQPAFLTLDLATYTREASGTGKLNIFATASPSTTLKISGSDITPVTMSKDTPNPVTFGKFSAQVPFSQLPASININNSLNPAQIAPFPVTAVDEITITQATYNPLTRKLKIKAFSQDRMLPLPTLTAVDFAGPNTFDESGNFTKVLTANPPSTVTAVSSRGGSASASVSFSVPPTAPVTSDDIAATSVNNAVTISVLANDTAAGEIDPESMTIVAASNGTAVASHSGTVTFTPSDAYSGMASFSYTVRDTFGQLSNAATVTVNVYGAATSATITDLPASPQLPGALVTFTAAASGGSGSYEFDFWLYNGTDWTHVQPYSASSTWTWNTSGYASGSYTIASQARNTGSAAPVETTAYLTYRLTNPVSGVTVISSLPSPHPPGTAITFAAAGNGGSGLYEYRFSLYNGTTWSMVQNHSGNPFWTLPASTPAGNYVIAVDVRNAGTNVVRDTVAYYPFTFSTPATGVSVTADQPSPHPTGTSVMFTASGAGGSGSYEYRFFYYDGATWTMVQNYGIGSSWTLPGSTPAGTYTIAVDVRSAGSAADRDAVSYLGYVVQ